jgi:tetratricopeptide (TPR) repeat protein
MIDADQSFEAALGLWNRSPSPMIDTLLRRALALQEAAVGPVDPAVARTRDRIGRNAYNGGNFLVAERMFRDAVVIAEPRATDRDLEFAEYLGDLGAAIREQHRYAEAWPPVCRSLAIRRAALPKAHPLIAASLNNMGRIALGQKQFPEARVLMEEAYRINLAAYGSHEPLVQQQAQLLVQLRQAAPGEIDPVDPCAAPPLS